MLDALTGAQSTVLVWTVTHFSKCCVISPHHQNCKQS